MMTALLAARQWARQVNFLVWAAPRTQGSSRHRGVSHNQSCAGLKDSVAERPNRSNLCTSDHIRIRSKFYQNSGKFLRTLQKIWKCKDFSILLQYSAKLREIFIRISAKFDEMFWKIEDFSTVFRIFFEIPRKNHQNRCKIRWKLSKNRDFCRNSSKNTKEVWRIFAKILNLERCEGVQIL